MAALPSRRREQRGLGADLLAGAAGDVALLGARSARRRRPVPGDAGVRRRELFAAALAAASRRGPRRRAASDRDDGDIIGR